jgi:hypothetical protein
LGTESSRTHSRSGADATDLFAAWSQEGDAEMTKFLAATAVSVGILAPTTNGEHSQLRLETTPTIEGVWKGVSVVVAGPNGYTIPNRLPAVIIYTKQHYSVLTQDSDGRQSPRQAPPPFKTPGKPTDAEKIALYEHWAPVVADAGTYELKGTTLTQRQIVSKHGTLVERTREVRIEDGGNTLVEITTSAPGQPARETRRTFTRLE